MVFFISLAHLHCESLVYAVAEMKRDGRLHVFFANNLIHVCDGFVHRRYAAELLTRLGG